MEINKSIVISELNSAIKSLKMKSPGLDMVHNIFFKHIPTRIHSDLLKIINKSWETSEVPVKWKESVVIPILKPKILQAHCSAFLYWKIDGENCTEKIRVVC